MSHAWILEMYNINRTLSFMRNSRLEREDDHNWRCWTNRRQHCRCSGHLQTPWDPAGKLEPWELGRSSEVGWREQGPSHKHLCTASQQVPRLYDKLAEGGGRLYTKWKGEAEDWLVSEPLSKMKRPKIINTSERLPPKISWISQAAETQ